MDKAASPYAVYDHRFPATENEVKTITDRFAKDPQFLAVCELAAQKVIGFISIYGENEKERNFGYTFHSAYWGKGYASEACAAVVEYAFNVLGIEKLHSGAANLNYPSVKLLLSLGFRKTGEEICSFWKTPEGKPIEFTGSYYLLEKDRY